MAHNNDFTLTHFEKETSQRETSLGQVPFFLSTPLGLRQFLEVILGVNWRLTEVANSTSYTIGNDDVVIASGHSTTITLPSVSAGGGRLLIIKDQSGACATSGQSITINRSGSDTIDGVNTSFKLQANYGAVMLISGASTQWHILSFT